MNKLLIYGAAYFDLLKLIDAINEGKPTWEIIGFIDDTLEKQGKEYWDIPVVGGREKLKDYKGMNDVYVFNNISGHWGKNRTIAALLDEHHCKVPNLIHPAVDMNYVSIGRGCILPDGCIVGSNSRVKDFVTVRLGSIISHDVTIESHVFIGPGVTIGSEAVIEEGAFIGAGATIMLKRRIGHGALIGAASLINKDVAENRTVAGVPAKELNREM